MIEKIISGYCVLNIYDSVVYAAKGYKIYKSYDETKTWELDGIVDDFKFSNLARLINGPRGNGAGFFVDLSVALD